MNPRLVTTEAECCTQRCAALPAQGATLRILWSLTLTVLCVGGCRGAAYRDVYQQKMASEIRILEDQLYEADYHNQVLAEELARAKARIAMPDDRRRGPSTAQPLEQRSPSPPRAAADARREDRTAPTLPARPIPDVRDRRVPPEVAIPPGPDDLNFPDVDLGEPIPPAGRGAAAELPPGHIPLPNGVRKLQREQQAIPTAIRINQGLSGGYRFDDAEERTGIHVAIEAVDAQNRQVALEDFDVAGDLRITVLDAQGGASGVELGRWDYSEEDLQSMIRPGSPGGRIHAYIPWNDKRPSGGKVVVQVCLSSDDIEFNAQAELATAEQSVAQWTPRGAPRPGTMSR